MPPHSHIQNPVPIQLTIRNSQKAQFGIHKTRIFSSNIPNLKTLLTSLSTKLINQSMNSHTISYEKILIQVIPTFPFKLKLRGFPLSLLQRNSPPPNPPFERLSISLYLSLSSWNTHTKNSHSLSPWSPSHPQGRSLRNLSLFLIVVSLHPLSSPPILTLSLSQNSRLG